MTNHPNRATKLDFAIGIANEIADLVSHNVALHSPEGLNRIENAVRVLDAAGRLYGGDLTKPAYLRMADRRDSLRQMAANVRRINKF